MLKDIQHWWNRWIAREVRAPMRGAFPQVFCVVDYKHLRTRLTFLVHPDPEEYVEREFRDREGAYYRNGYKGEW